jgi:hypothetical protein
LFCACRVETEQFTDAYLRELVERAVSCRRDAHTFGVLELVPLATSRGGLSFRNYLFLESE